MSQLLRLYRLSQKSKQSKPSNRRANKVRLLPKGSAERKLEKLEDDYENVQRAELHEKTAGLLV
ncbi:MAG: hypothetical protein ACP5LF_00105 [Nitrososphaeria archaeon]